MSPAFPSPCTSNLQRLVTLLPVAAFLTRENRISFVNPAALRLFDASEQALTGHSPLEFLDLRALSIKQSPSHGSRSDDPSHAWSEGVVLSADGAVRLVQTSAARLDDQDPTTLLVLMHDVTELKKSQTKLANSQTELRRMAAQVDHLQQNERARLASELHDELRQALAAIRMELGALGAQLAGHHDPAVARLEYISLLALNAMESAGRIVNDLHPPILEDLGLAAALEALVAQVAQRSGLHCRFRARIDAQTAVLGRPMVARTLFRAAKDMLDAVTRQAQVSAIHVSLLGAHNGSVQLRVSHSGGSAAALHTPSWDEHVSALQERLLAVGGEIKLSSVGRSHMLDATVPVAPPVASAIPESATTDQADSLYAALLRFLYRAPVGLVQTTLEGRIEMLNPRAAQLLLPFANDGQLSNLLDLLVDAAPQLASRVAQMDQPSGQVCNAMSITLPASEPGAVPHTLTLSLLKQDGVRLMAVLS